MRPGMLLAIGLVSELVYLAAAARLPWWRYGGTLTSWVVLLGGGQASLGLCLAAVGLLMTAYLWGWHLMRTGKGRRKIVWGFAGLFAVTLFWLMPITSDVFVSLSRAHIFTDFGANPLLDAPLDYRDPLLLAYPAFYAIRSSAYGPLWALISAPATLGPYDVAAGLFYLKGLAVASYLGCVWLLERILRELRPAAALEGLYMFAWNPLVLLMAVGDGHNDIVMMALVLLAVWLLLRSMWIPAFGALALSIWIKYVSLIFLPLFALHAWRQLDSERVPRRWAPLAAGGLLVGLVSLLILLPFGDLKVYLELADRFLWPANWSYGLPNLATWGVRLGLLAFVALYAILAWRILQAGASFPKLANACFIASLLAFVLGAARSQSWHLIWPAAMAGLSDQRWAWPTVVALSVAMLVVQLWVEWGAPGIGFHS